MFEFEIKAELVSREAIEGSLEKKGCRLSAPLCQHDYIFAADAQQVTQPSPGTVVMRIRVEDQHRATLTQKVHRSHELDCIEREVVIKEHEVMRDILSGMGWSEVVEVQKSRRTARSEPYTVVIDDVSGLGAFVEIERTSKTPLTDDQIRELEAFAASLDGMGERVTTGYDRLLLELNDHVAT